MKPKDKQKSSLEGESGKILLMDLLDHQHPLFQLAEAIDWEALTLEFEVYYAEEIGRPGLSSRLLIGLHYLKYLFEESDESVVEKFVENPYWQYFCGCEYFEHSMPCHPTTLVKWRGRVGVEGMEKLLKETVRTARREQFLRASEFKRVTVDTSVQEKAIAFPTERTSLSQSSSSDSQSSERSRDKIEAILCEIIEESFGPARSLRTSEADAKGWSGDAKTPQILGMCDARCCSQVFGAFLEVEEIVRTGPEDL